MRLPNTRGRRESAIRWSAKVARAALSVLLAAAFASGAGVAAAAPSAAPLDELKSVLSTRGSGETILIVSGRLPDSTALPAEMVIPVPRGVTPIWVGEIVGTDPSKDPQAKYQVSKGDSKYDAMTITLTTSRVGQAEFLLTPTSDSRGTTLTQSLPILGKVKEAGLRFELDTGWTVVSSSKELKKDTAGPAGVTVYTLTRTALSGGDELAAEIVAKAPAAGSPAARQPTGTVGPGTAAPTTPGTTTSKSPTNIWSILLVAAIAFFGYNLYRFVTDKKRAEAAELAAAAMAQQKAAEKPAAKRGGQPRQRPDAHPTPQAERSARPAPPRHASGGDDLVGRLKKLAALNTAGLLTPDEFTTAKARLADGDDSLLARLLEISDFHDRELLTTAEHREVQGRLLAGDEKLVAQVEELAELNSESLLTAEEFRAFVDKLLDS